MQKGGFEFESSLSYSASIKNYFDTAPYFLYLGHFDEQPEQLQPPFEDFFMFLNNIYPAAITNKAVIKISK